MVVLNGSYSRKLEVNSLIRWGIGIFNADTGTDMGAVMIERLGVGRL